MEACGIVMASESPNAAFITSLAMYKVTLTVACWAPFNLPHDSKTHVPHRRASSA